MNKFNINTPNLDDIIQQYLYGELSGEDIQELELAISQDEELKTEVEFIRGLQSSLREKRRSETREMLQRITTSLDIEENPEQLKKLEEQLKQTLPKDKPGFSPFKIVGISLGIVITGMLIWLFVPFTISQTEGVRLFQQYYAPFALNESVDPGSAYPPDQALHAYSESNYSNVITLLEEYPDYTTEMDLLMALGISYIENKERSKAEKVFMIVSKDTVDIYARDADWYLALLYLNQHKVTEARSLLTDLQQHERYRKRAEEVLNAIPENRFSKYIK